MEETYVGGMFVVHIEVYRKDEMDPTKLDQDRELLQWHKYAYKLVYREQEYEKPIIMSNFVWESKEEAILAGTLKLKHILGVPIRYADYNNRVANHVKLIQSTIYNPDNDPRNQVDD